MANRRADADRQITHARSGHTATKATTAQKDIGLATRKHPFQLIRKGACRLRRAVAIGSTMAFTFSEMQGLYNTFATP
jgi:hypothetical protein